jgi:hypothetical protein
MIKNYTGSSHQTSKSDLPLWRTNNICKIHCGAVVIGVICIFMDYGRCIIIIFGEGTVLGLFETVLYGAVH